MTHPPTSSPCKTLPNRQGGAALAVALIILVVLTLLGIAAVQFTQSELRMAQNAESRLYAQQQADSLLDFVISNPDDYLPTDNQQTNGCFLPASLTAPDFTCDADDETVTMPEQAERFKTLGYVSVQRQLPLFITVNSARGRGTQGGVSGRNFDYANYEVVTGYDNSAAGFSASEVASSVLVLRAKPAAISQFDY